MILKWNESVGELCLPPAKAWDGEGNELPRHTWFIDTETGLVGTYLVDRLGMILVAESEHAGTLLCSLFGQVTLPIHIEWDYETYHQSWDHWRGLK